MRRAAWVGRTTEAATLSPTCCIRVHGHDVRRTCAPARTRSTIVAIAMTHERRGHCDWLARPLRPDLGDTRGDTTLAARWASSRARAKIARRTRGILQRVPARAKKCRFPGTSHAGGGTRTPDTADLQDYRRCFGFLEPTDGGGGCREGCRIGVAPPLGASSVFAAWHAPGGFFSSGPLIGAAGAGSFRARQAGLHGPTAHAAFTWLNGSGIRRGRSTVPRTAGDGSPSARLDRAAPLPPAARDAA